MTVSLWRVKTNPVAIYIHHMYLHLYACESHDGVKHPASPLYINNSWAKREEGAHFWISFVRNVTELSQHSNQIITSY